MPAAAPGRTQSRTRTRRRATRVGAPVRWDPKPMLAERRGVTPGAAIMARVMRPARPETSPVEDPFIQWLAQPCAHVPSAPRQLIQEEQAMVGPQHLPRQWQLPVAISPTSEMEERSERKVHGDRWCPGKCPNSYASVHLLETRVVRARSGATQPSQVAHRSDGFGSLAIATALHAR
jgi:hypothetical protein